MGVLSTITEIMRALTKTKKKGKLSSSDSQLVDTSSSAVSGWACLPTDILNLVLDRITDSSDFIRFCCVCHLWRFIALQPPLLDSRSHSYRLRCQHHQNLQLLKTYRNQLPLLLMCSPRDDSQNQYKQNAFSVTHGTIYDIHLPIPYPVTYFGYKKRFVGSTRGWLFLVDPSYLVIKLINPFLNRSFSLPEFNGDRGERIYVINQAKLLSEPDKGDYYEVLVKWNGRNMAYFTSKTQKWNTIDGPSGGDWFKDTIFYKGQIYSISEHGYLLNRRNFTHVAYIATAKIHMRSISLVESQEGDLLLVRRHNRNSPSPIKIEVYKLSYSRGRIHPKFVKISSIGKQALFIGDYGESISVSTRDFPMCKPNCIYYYDRYFHISDTSKRGQQGKEYAAYPYSLSDDSASKIWILPYFKPYII